LLGKCVIAFVDHLLIYSQTEQEHRTHVRSVLELLRQNQLYAKASKCQFGKSKVEFLGHIVGAERFQVEPNKNYAIMDWPTPQTGRDVRSFIGLAIFYRRFVQGFSKIAAPLTKLMTPALEKSKSGLPWADEAEVTFQQIKQVLCTAPVPATPDAEGEFMLQTAAPDVGLGAVL
jgi:hypothetical protein